MAETTSGNLVAQYIAANEPRLKSIEASIVSSQNSLAGLETKLSQKRSELQNAINERADIYNKAISWASGLPFLKDLTYHLGWSADSVVTYFIKQGNTSVNFGKNGQSFTITGGDIPVWSSRWRELDNWINNVAPVDIKNLETQVNDERSRLEGYRKLLTDTTNEYQKGLIDVQRAESEALKVTTQAATDTANAGNLDYQKTKMEAEQKLEQIRNAGSVETEKAKIEAAVKEKEAQQRSYIIIGVIVIILIAGVIFAIKYFRK